MCIYLNFCLWVTGSNVWCCFKISIIYWFVKESNVLGEKIIRSTLIWYVFINPLIFIYLFHQAKSISLGFTSLIDNGLNYCNLYSLVSSEFRSHRVFTWMVFSCLLLWVMTGKSDTWKWKCLILICVWILVSGLTESKGFMEITSEWACLGYGFALCKD